MYNFYILGIIKFKIGDIFVMFDVVEILILIFKR